MRQSNHDSYPPDQQSAVVEFGIQLCTEALAISRELGDTACEAFYLYFLAADAYDRQNSPTVARGLYEQAVTLYQGLTKNQPEMYGTRLETTLTSLANLLKD